MIHFFRNKSVSVFAVQSDQALSASDIEKLSWLFGNAGLIEEAVIEAAFIRPRATMMTPWSTNAVDIVQDMGSERFRRMEYFVAIETAARYFAPRLFRNYNRLGQNLFP